MIKYTFVQRDKQGHPAPIATAVVENDNVTWAGEHAQRMIGQLRSMELEDFPEGIDTRNPSNLTRLPEIFSGRYLWVTKEEGEFIERGGVGSGHHGHAGRPGEVGGSQREAGVNPVTSGVEYDFMPKSLTTDVPRQVKEAVEDVFQKLGLSPDGLYVSDSPTKIARIGARRYAERQGKEDNQEFIKRNEAAIKRITGRQGVGGFYIDDTNALFINSKSFRQERMGPNELKRLVSHEVMHYLDDYYLGGYQGLEPGKNFNSLMVMAGYPRSDFKHEYIAALMELEYIDRASQGTSPMLQAYRQSTNTGSFVGVDPETVEHRAELMRLLEGASANLDIESRSLRLEKNIGRLTIAVVDHWVDPDFEEVLFIFE